MAMAAELAPGSRFAGYRIERLLGRGGMGAVYRATELALGRPVALKVILGEHAGDDPFRRRFEREARLAARLVHPNVVTVHEAGEHGGRPFIAMALIEGTDLEAVMAERGRLAPRQAAAVVAQLGSALDAAHAIGLVHRDVKPANVLLAPGDRVFLTDFGLSRTVLSQTRLTRTGHWVGTLDYAPPEQIRGEEIDSRVDVYALGCLLYQALTGEIPYPRSSEVQKMVAHASDPPPLPSAAGAPAAFDEVIAHAMAKDPGARWPSAGALARAALAAASVAPGDAGQPLVSAPAERPVVDQGAPTAAGAAPPAS